MITKTCAIVDAFSTGSQLATYFHQYGYDVIHIQSLSNVALKFQKTFRPQDFIANVIHNGDLKNTVEFLEKYQLEFIIPGTESGVELSDYLSCELGLIRNSDEHIEARRDKYMMIDIVKKAGLNTIKQVITSNAQELLTWAEEINQWPIVMKPLKSAGSENVRFCYSPSDISQTFDEIYGTTSMFGLKNNEVLAQTYAKGQQYIVNAVTYEGKHLITDIWQANMIETDDNRIMYDDFILLERSGEVQNQLVVYTESVLTALGISFGPTHTELRLTEDGPILIETGARMMGESLDEQVMLQLFDYNYPSLTSECYAAPERFIQRFGTHYQLQKHVMVVFLISHQEGLVEKINLDALQELSSVQKVKLNVGIKEQLVQTREALTHVGYVLLVSDIHDQLVEDHKKIRLLEKQGELFQVYAKNMCT